jgi:hypothetical protein
MDSDEVEVGSLWDEGRFQGLDMMPNIMKNFEHGCGSKGFRL